VALITVERSELVSVLFVLSREQERPGVAGAQDVERGFGDAQGGVAGRWERSGGPELAGHGVKEPPQPWNRSAMADTAGFV
jgi:hypothetical protein